MGLNRTLRAIEAAERRQQRESQKRLRELERLAKARAKLSAIEQARLEVETYEGQLEVLLSVHKSHSEVWAWGALAASLPPHRPRNNSYYEFKAKQLALVLHPQKREGSSALIDQARLLWPRLHRLNGMCDRRLRLPSRWINPGCCRIFDL